MQDIELPAQQRVGWDEFARWNEMLLAIRLSSRRSHGNRAVVVTRLVLFNHALRYADDQIGLGRPRPPAQFVNIPQRKLVNEQWQRSFRHNDKLRLALLLQIGRAHV